jgi:signal transduction histidine kinase
VEYVTVQPTSPSPAPVATTPPAEGTPVVRPHSGASLLLRSWGWGWLAIVQLTGDLLLAGPYLAMAALVLAGVISLTAVGFGIVMLAVLLPLAMVVAAWERMRVEAFLGVRIAPPRAPSPDLPLWRRLLTDGRPWRAVVHMTVLALWGLVAGTTMLVMLCTSVAVAALPLYRSQLPGGKLTVFSDVRIDASPWVWGVGTAVLLVLPLVARGLIGVDLALARSLLGRGRHEEVAQLTQRVETLTQTREMAVDSVELERRRIERDLHDGPQQRLVAIAMDLGLAQTKLEADPNAAKDLLGKAHTAAKEAIVEMRQVARGIHPPVLTDRGLDAALSALAARSPVPVSVHVELPTRPSPTIEAIAYFCVSEALTNVAKHAGARSATVHVARLGGAVQVQVTDDGRGGATPGRGTGLTGLRQRLAAVDGSLTVVSPPGAGTQLIMTLPERPEPRTDTDHTPRSTP